MIGKENALDIISKWFFLAFYLVPFAIEINDVFKPYLTEKKVPFWGA
tara:strand:- start:304678 stop:304818 length:141 start_codon:yes stop_codon:yes gene_type:complete